MKRYIYIDDLREPLISEAEWVKTYNETVSVLRSIPKDCCLMVDFDHDLGSDRTGYDIALWLVENEYTGMFRVHSMNPVGRNNIRSLLTHYGWTEFY